MAATETIAIRPNTKLKIIWFLIYGNVYGVFALIVLKCPYGILQLLSLIVALTVSWDAYKFLTACLKRKPFFKLSPTHFEDNFSRPFRDDPTKIPWEHVVSVDVVKPKQLSLVKVQFSESSPFGKRLILFTWPTGYKGERFADTMNSYLQK